ncbi:hypothetical protein [Halobaculum lipolyticum]|uniref:Uncharacterized protein n=1 Tax=Halobaculum lipolyticum TaxID=3032001 RepID=A0ABD5WCJ7_9EURY|nr:hypothetical protein [Halobaculum sp. DT31]
MPSRRDAILGLAGLSALGTLAGCLGDRSGDDGNDDTGTAATGSPAATTRPCPPTPDYTDSPSVEVFSFLGEPRAVTLTVEGTDGDAVARASRTLSDGDVWRFDPVPDAAGTFVVRVAVAGVGSDAVRWEKERNTYGKVDVRVGDDGVTAGVGRHTVMPPERPDHC